MNNPLGQNSPYPDRYDPTLLFPIERESSRHQARIDSSQFSGYDCWNGHELGWLDLRGKPHVSRVRLVYPSDSRCIVESKSLKLYFVSFGMARFENDEAVRRTIKHDLEAMLGAAWVKVTLLPRDHPLVFRDDDGLIDDEPVDCDQYQTDSGLLQASTLDAVEDRTYLSHLLKTNCPVTGQPDWGTVRISFRGGRDVSRESLLRYLVSYREHSGFHELCCEEIFRDLHHALEPEELLVQCFFTRRGGIDINPCRYSGISANEDYEARYWRQ